MEVRTYASFEEYAYALGHPDLRLVALGRERAPWSMGCADVDGIRIRTARDGGPCLFNAALAARGVGLLLCLDAAGKVTANGRVFGPRSVLVIPGRAEVQSASLDTVAWLSVFIPAERLAPADGRDADARQSRVVDPAPQDYRTFLETLQRIVSAARAGAFRSNPLGQRQASQELVAMSRGLLGLPGSPGDRDPHAHAGRHRIPREAILRLSREAIEGGADPTPRLRQLAAAAGMSERTLHNAFREQLGVSPQRFLRHCLLNAAYRDLRRSDSDAARVTDVLTKLGIWDWGRFSRDYRRLFGELPSQTLRRRPQGHRSPVRGLQG